MGSSDLFVIGSGNLGFGWFLGLDETSFSRVSGCVGLGVGVGLVELGMCLKLREPLL